MQDARNRLLQTPLEDIVRVCWPIDATRLSFLTGETINSADARLRDLHFAGKIILIGSAYKPIVLLGS